jgi:hypothetical protein
MTLLRLRAFRARGDAPPAGPRQPAPSAPGAGAAHGALAFAIFAAGVALRATNLGGPSFAFDEYYDVYTAKSFLAGEGFRLPGGAYERGRFATLLVVAAFALFGESEASARLPAVLFGALTMGLVYASGRFLFGPAAGLVALALQALSPDAIDADRFARLYSPLTFLHLLAGLSAFRALEGQGDEGPRLSRARLGWLALGLAAGGLAVEQHAVALGLFAVVQLYVTVMALGLLVARRRRDAAGYGLVAVAMLLTEGLALAHDGLRGRIFGTALTALPWYRPAADEALLYHQHLVAQYGWLWYLAWPATVVAVLARARAGLFVAAAFWLPLVVMSGVVATKHPRYVIHLLPFAWLLLGGAAGALWPAARDALLARLDRTLPPRVPRRAAALLVLLVTLLPLARFSPSAVAALRRPAETVGTHFTTNYFQDWRGLARALEGRLEPDARVVAGVPLAARYYLRRTPYRLMSPYRRDAETAGRLEEGRVQHAAQLAALRAGGAPVWVVVERWRWDEPERVDAELKQMLLRDCGAVTLPATLDFRVFACDAPHDAGARPPGARPPGAQRRGAAPPR